MFQIVTLILKLYSWGSSYLRPTNSAKTQPTLVSDDLPLPDAVEGETLLRTPEQQPQADLPAINGVALDTPADLIDIYVDQVLEIVPDVELDHLAALVRKYLTDFQDEVAQRVVHLLLEDPTYPKVSWESRQTGDGIKEDNGDQGKPEPTLDYANKDRKSEGGAEYNNLALVSHSKTSPRYLPTFYVQNQLSLDFPYIPVPHLRRVFLENNTLYAPTYIFLSEEQKGGNLSYTPKLFASRANDKGKAKQDARFEAERQWIIHHLDPGVSKKADTLRNFKEFSSRAWAKAGFKPSLSPRKVSETSLAFPKASYTGASKIDTVVAQEATKQEHDDDDDDGIECGCCFSTYTFVGSFCSRV